MAKYAEETKVPVQQSLTEIQKLLTKYGADKFGYVQNTSRVGIEFLLRERRIRFIITMPQAAEFYHHRYRSSEASQQRACEQATRTKYRALVLAIKAKLEAVESNIETLEEAFMAHIVLPNGETLGKWAVPQIENSYKSGKMPPLLGNF